jgi:hypothetical protein
MQKFINRTVIIAMTLVVAACSSTTDQTQRAPAFLPNYSLLKEVPSPDGTKIYTYKNPNVKPGDYSAAIVEPVSLYQTATKDGIADAQIEKARAEIDAGLQQIVSRKLKLTTQPGAGVLRLQVAITGARLESDGFKPWNIIPISAAIKLASMATGLDAKKPVLVVELKFTDSQTGNLLKEVVTTISGDKLSNKNDVTNGFDKLATAWVQDALKYSN